MTQTNPNARSPGASELRALDVLDHVPPGCKLELVTSAYNAPHLRPGEFAVADLGDRKLVSGELYLIRYPSGGRAIRCVSLRVEQNNGAPFEGIWFSPLCRPTYTADGSLDLSKPVFLSDGPLRPIYLDKYLMGRIIGIFEAPEILDVDALPRPDVARWIEE